MNAESDRHDITHAFVRLVALLTFATALAVLGGWIFDVPALKSVLPTWVAMKANTALCFALSATAVFLILAPPVGAGPGLRQLGITCAAIVSLIAAPTLGEYAFNWHSGFDQLLFQEAAGAIGTSHPGRMAPESAVCFLLLAALLITYAWPCKLRSSILLMALAGVLIECFALLSLSSFMLPGSSQFGWFDITAMAVHTAILFCLLGASVLAALAQRLAGTWRLKQKIVFIALATFLASMWLLTFHTGRLLQQDLKHHLGAQQVSIAALLAAEIGQEINDRMGALEMVAKRITPAMLRDEAALHSTLDERTVFTGLFNSGVIVIGADGVATASVPPALAPERRGRNYLYLDAVTAALKDGVASVGKPIVGPVTGVPSIGMVVPIRDAQGRPIGALAGVMHLGESSFLHKIFTISYGMNGNLLLVDRSHRIIITATDKARVMEVLPPPGTIPAMDGMLNDEEGYTLFRNAHGVEVLTAAKGIPVAGWMLSVSLPTKEAFAPIYHLQKEMLLSAILLTVLACALIWWQLRRQLFPALSTLSLLKTMTDGSSPMRLLPVDRNDEIGDMVQGFNALMSKLQQREAELRDSEYRWKFAIEGSGAGLWDWDFATGTVYYSPRWKQMLGYAEDEIGDKPDEWQSRIHPDDRQSCLDAMQTCFKVANNPNLVECEYRLRGKSGGYIWVSTRGMVVKRGKNDQALRVIATSTDITQRLEQQSALRQFFDQPAALHLVCRLDGTILRANSGWKTILGYDAAGLQGRNVLDLILPEDRAASIAAMNDLGQGKPLFHFGNRYLTPGGEHRWLYWSASCDTKLSVIYATGLDDTERRQITAALSLQSEIANNRNRELTQFNQLAVDRELDMIDLKRRVNVLSLELGRAAPFDISFADRPTDQDPAAVTMPGTEAKPT